MQTDRHTCRAVLLVCQPLECGPVMLYVLGRRGRESKLLLRGDSQGRLSIWQIPDVSDNKMKLARQDSFENLPGVCLCGRLCMGLYNVIEHLIASVHGICSDAFSALVCRMLTSLHTCKEVTSVSKVS